MNAAILAEEVLLLLLYGFEMLAFPSYRAWDQSYEGWLSRNGFLRRMHWLERQKFIERQGRKGAWVFRITPKGRDSVRGSVNPEARWNRGWDGWWRQLIFDLPVEHKRARERLLRWLRQNCFGYLQDSVWITPDPVTDLADSLKKFRDDAATFTLLESRCAPGFSDSALIASAWQFDRIGEAYREYQRFAASALEQSEGKALHPKIVFALLREEGGKWRAAFDQDPLLPRCLWPARYLGPSALSVRTKLLRSLAAQLPPISA